MTHSFKVVVPARYASTRLPGKPLRMIAGMPMIQHVWLRAQESGAEQVVIATDDERIASVARQFGAQVCVTRKEHSTGTDRLAEVVETLAWDDAAIVINLQGDEPMMPPELVQQVAADLATHSLARIATPATAILTTEEFLDPNVVKVVMDQAGYALYFSRAPIPWDRDHFANGNHALPSGIRAFRHLGLYAYRAGFLRSFTRLQVAPVEQVECLEQLRALWSGERIHVVEAVCQPGPGVDTEKDLVLVERLMASQQSKVPAM